MKDYAVRWDPLSKRFEIVRIAPAKKNRARIVVDRMEAGASVISAVVEMMQDGVAPGGRVALDFNIGESRYKLTLEEIDAETIEPDDEIPEIKPPEGET